LQGESLEFCIGMYRYLGDQIKEGDMSGACNTHGKDEKCIQNVVQKT
jgi:hypothetical protein